MEIFMTKLSSDSASKIYKQDLNRLGNLSH